MSSTKDLRVPRSSAVGCFNSRSIRVNVGEGLEYKTFFVHEELICSRSDFFKIAMKEPWKEAEEYEVTLAEEEPETFSLYLELLYTSVLPVRRTESDIDHWGEYVNLSKLYVLAEMLMDEDTKNVVLAAILDKSKEVSVNGTLSYTYYLDGTSIQIIYDRTPEGSPARRLLVDLYTTFGDETFKLAEFPDLPKDFFFDLAVNLMAKRPTL